jgi:hypothetical protein
MTYAKARLWLGISGVGMFVIASATSLWLDLPRLVLSRASGVEAIGWTLCVYVVLSIPGDLLGGYVLPRRYARACPEFGAFVGSWFRGITLQALVMGVCAFVILQAAVRGGSVGAAGAFTILMLFLLHNQGVLARLAGGLRPDSPLRARAIESVSGMELRLPEVVVYGSTDPGFIGGLVGLPGRERLVLPGAWVERLPVDTLRMQVTRRIGALGTGARTRGIILAVVWNLSGFVLASQMPHADLRTAAGLISAGLWFVLWSFLGLVLLPTLSRLGVLEADRFAGSHGVDKAMMERGMTELDRLQDDEPNRSRWVERVFHPIPSVSNRMEALERGTERLGAWQGARMTLYLSWAFFGLLSRAVHCNAGRPQLWVLFPGD